MIGPIAAITGASGGIGTELAMLAAHRGYSLVLHARRAGALGDLLSRLAAECPTTQTAIVEGDLDTAAGALAVAKKISHEAPALDVLFNNAGVLLEGTSISADGIEMHVQVNLLAPYILMAALRPNLKREGGSIVNVSSGSLFRAGPLDVAQLKTPPAPKKLFGAYARSKLALSSLTNAVAETYRTDGIMIVSVEPGANKTAMTRGSGMPGILKLLQPFLFAAPDKGARRIFDALIAVQDGQDAGALFDGKKTRALPPSALDREVQRTLLRFCHQSTNGLVDIDHGGWTTQSS